MFCFQKDGGIKSLKVETLDPSLGQYDVVWLLHRGEAEGAWQLGQVTSYLHSYLQGVPKVRIHFVFCYFVGFYLTKS